MLRILSAVAVVLLVGSTAASAAQDPIGSVEEVSGEAFLVQQGVRRAAKLDGPVYPRDTLLTGPDGALGVILKDETRTSIGANSSATIESYEFEREEGGNLLLSFARGTLVMATGWLNKLFPGSTAVETEVSTIGVRGTKLMIELQWEEQ